MVEQPGTHNIRDKESEEVSLSELVIDNLKEFRGRVRVRRRVSVKEIRGPQSLVTFLLSVYVWRPGQ